MTAPYIPFQHYINPYKPINAQYPPQHSVPNSAHSTGSDSHARSNKRQRAESPVSTYERNQQPMQHISTPVSRAASPAPTAPYIVNTTAIYVQPYSSVNGSSDYNKYSNSNNSSTLPLTTSHSTDELNQSTKYIKPELSLRNRVTKLYRTCADAVQNTVSTASNSQLVKQLKQRYKALPSALREKLLFTVSSAIGTVLFLLLFESINQLLIYSLELSATVDTAFLFSYTASYLISIVWQHALNRMLLTSYNTTDIGYCASLLHTYTVYSASLAIVSLFGSLAIRYLYAPARLIALVSIPFAGVINYYSLQNDVMNSCIEQCVEQCSTGGGESATSSAQNRRSNNLYVFTPSNSHSSTVTYSNVKQPAPYSVQQYGMYNAAQRDSSSIAI